MSTIFSYLENEFFQKFFSVIFISLRMKDPVLLFQSPQKLLKLFGFWRGKNSSASSICRGFILHVLFIDIFLLFQFIYIYKLRNVDELSNLLKMGLTYVALFLKSINFLWKFGGISSLEASIRDLTQLSTCKRWQYRSEGLPAHVKRIRRIFYVLWISSLSTILVGALMVVLKRNERELPDKMWFPFDYKSSEFSYFVVSFYQMFGSIYACTINTVLDIYPVFFMSILVSVIEDLRDDLLAISQHKELVANVKRHRLLKRCFEDIRKNFSLVIFAQAGCSSIILCTTSFSLSTVSSCAAA